MSYIDDGKFSIEDFTSRSTIDSLSSLISDYNQSDEDGYTPLCFAVANGVRTDLIVYLINNKGASTNLVCDKGKYPLESSVYNLEAFNVLVGNKAADLYNENGNLVLKLDSSGNPIPKTDSSGNILYKKDAIGNDLPERDSEDNIIYNYDEHHIPIPITSDDGEYIAQQYLICTECNKEVFKVPPDVDYSVRKIIYKYDKNGNHQPMRDADGNPIKQYNTKCQVINKKDPVTFKPIKNQFEYVWDYEYQPKYIVDYETDVVSVDVDKLPIIDKGTILLLSQNKDSSLLASVADKYDGLWDPTLTMPYNPSYFTDDYNSPLISACASQILDSVKLILSKIVLPSDDSHTKSIKILKAIYHKTKEQSGVTMSADSSASSLKDITLFKAFLSYIDSSGILISSEDDDGKLVIDTMIEDAGYKMLNTLFETSKLNTFDYTYIESKKKDIVCGTDPYTSFTHKWWSDEISK